VGTIKPLTEKLNDNGRNIIVLHRILNLIVLSVKQQKQNYEHKKKRNEKYFIDEIERRKGRW
jgi:hypothetical protein